MSGSPTVVIVGGGNAGLCTYNVLASKLAATPMKLILVTPNTYYTHLPASARLVVTKEGKLEEKAFAPYTARFREGNNSLVHAKVTSIVDDDDRGRYVTLDNGENIDYSALILTPGCIWEGALEFSEMIGQEALASVYSWRDRFENAQDIVLVGGGGVGIEIAGEIKEQWPNKNVTIIHGPALMVNSTYPDWWRAKVAQMLERVGVNLVLGDRLDDLEPKDGKVVTRGGKTIVADLVISTRGPRPNTKFIESLDSNILNASGYVKVTPNLQVVGHPRIFAAGDVIDWNESKSAHRSRPHALVVATNVMTLLNGTGNMVNYQSSFEKLTFTCGRRGGIGYLDIFGGISFGDWLASLTNSRYVGLLVLKRKFNL